MPSKTFSKWRTIISLGFVLGCFGILFGCKPCSEEVWGTATSPDGKWLATTIERDCGATTSEVVSVNIHPIGQSSLREENNALVVKHAHTPGVTWLNDHSVSITCPECGAGEIIQKRASIGPISVQ
jgi:hypothetical protein